MDEQNKQILIYKDLLDLIENTGQMINLIQMQDMIKFGANDSFKDRLRTHLENIIDNLSESTVYYKVKYVHVEDIDSQMDINLILNRLFYYVVSFEMNVRAEHRDEKKLNQSISNIVYYIKVICSIYDIDYTRLVKSYSDYLLKD